MDSGHRRPGDGRSHRQGTPAESLGTMDPAIHRRPGADRRHIRPGQGPVGNAMSCDAVGGVPAPEPGWESTWTQASADVQATADAASSSGAGPPPNNVIVDVL